MMKFYMAFCHLWPSCCLHSRSDFMLSSDLKTDVFVLMIIVCEWLLLASSSRSLSACSSGCQADVIVPKPFPC